MKNNRLLFIGLLAFGARFGASVHFHRPFFPGGDSASYVEMAQALGDAGAPLQITHPPVYPIFLGLCLKLGGAGETVPFLIQALAAALGAAFVYLLSRRLGGDSLAWIAAMIYALDPFLIYFSTFYLSETLFTALLVAGLWAYVMAVQSKTAGTAALGGFLLGVGTLCRSILTPLLPLLMAGFFLALGKTAAKRWALTLAMVGGLACPLLLWSAYLHQRTGQWVLVSAQKGWNIYEGLNPDFNDPEAIVRWQAGMTAEAGAQHLTDPIAIDHYFWLKAQRIVRAHPGASLKLAARKYLKFWRAWPYFPYSRTQRIISFLYMMPLYLLTALGLWTLLRQPTFKAEWAVMGLFILFYSALNMITWTQIRYRVPLHPLLALFAGVGAGAFLQREKAKF